MRRALFPISLLLAIPSILPAQSLPGRALRLDFSRDGLPVVEVEIGGKPLRLALDTGTTRSMIAAGVAGKLGLEPRARFAVVTPDGSERTALCAGPLAIRVEGIEVTLECLGWVPGENDLAGAPGLDGVLGADALASLALWLDPRGHRARVAPTGGLAAWVEGERTRVEPVEERPAVAVSLPGLSGPPLRLVLDSGAGSTLLFGDAARSVERAVAGPRRRVELETASGRSVRSALALGRLHVGAAEVAGGWGVLLPEVEGRQEDGLLPLSRLGPVLLDLSAGVLVVDARLRDVPERLAGADRVAVLQRR